MFTKGQSLERKTCNTQTNEKKRVEHVSVLVANMLMQKHVQKRAVIENAIWKKCK